MTRVVWRGSHATLFIQEGCSHDMGEGEREEVSEIRGSEMGVSKAKAQQIE